MRKFLKTLEILIFINYKNLERPGPMNEDKKKKNVTLTRLLTRPFLLTLGWFAVSLGFIGVFVPGIPTTPFLLVALWAFSKTSKKFHNWLYNHPKFGQSLRDWHQHRVITVRVKFIAIVTMAVSFLWIVLGIADDWVLPTLVGVFLIPSAIFIITRSNRPK